MADEEEKPAPEDTLTVLEEEVRTHELGESPTDTAVLEELKEADEKACFTLMMIAAMRQSIEVFHNKEQLSDEDAKVLEEKQLQLMQKLTEFEEITDRVQRLVGLTGLTGSHFQPSFVKMLEGTVRLSADHSQEVSPAALISAPEESALEPATELVPEPAPESATELATELATESATEPAPDERLPKVVVCGLEDHVPRIIVCESPKRPEQRKRPGTMHKDGLMKSLTGRLNQSYSIQEKLATENADLEGVRYSLQEELIVKENTIECMQNKINSLQNEMRIIQKENSQLCSVLGKTMQQQRYPSQQQSPRTGESPCAPTCIVNKPGCGGQKTPKDEESVLQKYCRNTQCLEKQLDNIEQEVRRMQNDLVKVQKDRQSLENQKKLLKCTGPECMKRMTSAGRPATDDGAALRELKEQYARLQDDFKSKVIEVAGLRREIDSYKEVADKAREGQEAAEVEARSANERRNTLEKEANKMLASKEQILDQEQQLAVFKQRFRESQDELEELRALIQDQTSQLEDYRNKYLQAQQQVEEQRRQIEMMEMDNSRISEQVALEIQRVKNQFQERLQELTPLPDILKATQMKLQESQQLRAIAERNCEDLARECQEAKDKAQKYAKQLDDSVTSSNMDLEERGSIKTRLEKCEAKFNALKDENAELKTTVARMEEQAAQAQIRLDEKMHELAQLSSQLETVREESARQVSRTKERSEIIRRSLQNQISELERQLAQSRAAARTAQKDRDEIRQRMQGQINSLNESFDQAQMRLRSLQGHVNFLKTSYSNIFNTENQNPLMIADANPNQTCDCDQY